MVEAGSYIKSVLSGDSTVTGIVGTSIYDARRLPDSDSSNDTVNFYPVAPYAGGLNYDSQRWSISCRGSTNGEARTLAYAVKDALNRINVTVGAYEYYGVADILPVIQPVDETDNYNMPVELTIRRR
jgi:hypothetical protein